MIHEWVNTYRRIIGYFASPVKTIRYYKSTRGTAIAVERARRGLIAPLSEMNLSPFIDRLINKLSMQLDSVVSEILSVLQIVAP